MTTIPLTEARKAENDAAIAAYEAADDITARWKAFAQVEAIVAGEYRMCCLEESERVRKEMNRISRAHRERSKAVTLEQATAVFCDALMAPYQLQAAE